MFGMGTLLTQLNMPQQKYCMLENYTMSDEFFIHRASQESYMHLPVKQELWIYHSFLMINKQNQSNEKLVAIAGAYGIPHEVVTDWQGDVMTSQKIL